MKFSKFVCKCGCGRIAPPDIEQLIPELNQLQRILWGVYDLVRGSWEAYITSGYRCEKRNAIIGGAKFSPHIWGIAMDFALMNLSHREEVVEYLKSLGIVRVGHKKYEGIPNHIHIDLAHKIADALYEAKKIPVEVWRAYKEAKEW